MAVTTFARNTLNSRFILPVVGIATAVYMAAGLMLHEFNPLEWLNAPGRNYTFGQLNDEAMRLANRNGNGALEPSELEELFRRAGREPPRFTIQTYGLSGRFSTYATVPQTGDNHLTAGDLEKAIRSYQAEQ